MEQPRSGEREVKKSLSLVTKKMKEDSEEKGEEEEERRRKKKKRLELSLIAG